MSVKPDDKAIDRVLANLDEITEQEMNMTEAEFAARLQLIREQAAGGREGGGKAKGLHWPKGIWLTTIITGQRNEKNITRDRGGGGLQMLPRKFAVVATRRIGSR